PLEWRRQSSSNFAMQRRGFLRSLALLLCGSDASRALAQTKSPADPASPHRELCLYQGPDRDARILDAAKKEGSVSLYTSLNTKDSVPIKDAFEKKYGVKLVLWRASGEKVLQRAVTEARAGRHAVD